MTTEQLRALLAEATPGPWHGWHGDDDACMNAYGITSEPCDHEFTTDPDHSAHVVALTLLQSPRLIDIGDHSDGWFDARSTDTWRWVENRDLIVAAVNALPALLDVAEAARKALTSGGVDTFTARADSAIADLRAALDRLEAAS